jgi:hypothetical protein
MLKIKNTRHPVAASQFKLPGESTTMVGSNGELNASSKKELFARQAQFMSAMSNGMVTSDERAQMLEASAQNAAQNAKLLAAAFNDKDAHRILGERMADELYVTANRAGFMRKFLAKVTVQQGSIPRFPMRMKNVTAVYSTSPTKIESQITRDPWFTPPEFQIVARPFVPQNEINQSAGDVLQEKFVEATEALMVAEDRAWYNQAVALNGIDNNLTVVAGQLTPLIVAEVRNNVTRWGNKAAHLLIASDIMNDVIGNNEFQAAIDPVARHELLMTGTLGTMYGMTVITDAYRYPAHKVLNQGEFFVVSDPITHGAYSDRNGIQSQPTDISIEKIPGRGWVMYESMAMCIANSRSIAMGVRAY